MTPDPAPAPTGELAQVRTSEKTRARLSDLRPHPGNPRTISPARLAQLQRTLAAEPDMLEARPLIALPDGTVVAGNQRLAAAVALGWESIPVVYADLSPEEVTRWMLLDNRGFGEDDREAVAALLGELEAADSDLELTGYDPADLDAMLRELHRPAADPDAAPPVPVEPLSRLGDVYDLGPHRVMCGDSTDESTVETLLDGAKAQLVLADPPYNVGYHGGSSGMKRGREDAYHDVFADYPDFLARIFRNAHGASDDRAALLVWYSPTQTRALLAALDDTRWVDRSLIIWDKGSIKGGLGQVGKQYRSQFEPLRYCHKKGKTPRWHGPGNECDIWAVQGRRDNPLHPTMKPVALYERSLTNHSQWNDLAVEMFGGSGTSIIAAEMTGRRCFAMELEPRFVDVIRQRYADYVGDQKWAP